MRWLERFIQDREPTLGEVALAVSSLSALRDDAQAEAMRVLWATGRLVLALVDDPRSKREPADGEDEQREVDEHHHANHVKRFPDQIQPSVADSISVSRS